MKRPLTVLLALTSAFAISSFGAHAAVAGPPTGSAHDLPNRNVYYEAPRVAGVKDASAPPAFVASRDEQRGAPAFVWAARDPGAVARAAGLTYEDAARMYLADHAARYGLTREALATAVVTQIHDVGHGGIIVVFRQRIGGADVFHSDVKVLMTRNRELVAMSGALHPDGVAHPKVPASKVDKRTAIAAAFGDLESISISPQDFALLEKTKGDYVYYGLGASLKKSGFYFVEPARIKRVFFPLPDRLVPAYFLELVSGRANETTSDAYAYVISAVDGSILYRENLTHYDTFNYRVWADPGGDKRPQDGPLVDYTPHPTGIPDGSYPGFAAPSLVSVDSLNKLADPWLPPNATETKGNNVDAYTDDDQPDGFSANDIRASTTAFETFDRTYDVTLDPQSSDPQRMAAITDLFYVTNWLHDYWYDSGFDEMAGNAQASNYGRGGLEGDVLHAEAQDGAPGQRNNSNMSAMSDGTSPRMQMFVWDGAGSASLTTQPQNRNFPVGLADFGPQSFNVVANVTLVDDGTGTTTDACEPITNNISGTIGLVDRGNCTFKLKAVNIAAAGGIGMILVDKNVAGQPPAMSDGQPPGPVSIPLLSLTLADGNTLKQDLMNGPVTATMLRTATVTRDGTIENSVIAHEWGHYIHLRQVACGVSICSAESEGWGDFIGLITLVRQADNLNGTFALAQYATVAFPDDPAYFGIRRYPYSIDMNKDPLTFHHIEDQTALPMGPPIANGNNFGNSEVHAAGEIWTTMLWQGLVTLLQQSEQPNPPYTFEEARRRMADYVEGGFKMAPTDPTYTEQRDAILATAYAADKNDFQLLAQAFATRGAGTCAVSPPRDSTDFNGVVEDYNVKPNGSLLSIKVDDSISSCDKDGNLDAGELGNITVSIMNTGTAPLTGATLDIASKAMGVTFPNGASVPVPTIDPFSKADVTIEVGLDAMVMSKEQMDITATLNAASGCQMMTQKVSAPLVNFDQVPMASTTDDVEATTTWKITGMNSQEIWSITEPTPGDHAWHGGDYASPSDSAILSPEIDVDPAQDFVLKFDHRFDFEASMGVLWDGGVVEVSLDGGQTWLDAANYGNPGYTGTLGDPMNQAQNVLKGRTGYGGQNPSWPNRDTVTIDMAKKLAGQKVVFRFRIGTDDAKGASGWDIDNISFTGITNKPFNALVDDMTACVPPDSPKADAGPDQTVTSGDTVDLDGSKSSDPNGLPLTFAWSEVAGPMVTLTGGTTAMPTFTAPSVMAKTTLTMKLIVDDGKLKAFDTVDITVLPREGGPDAGTDGGGKHDGGSDQGGAVPGDDGGCGCFIAGNAAPSSTGAYGWLAALALVAAGRRRRRLG